MNDYKAKVEFNSKIGRYTCTYDKGGVTAVYVAPDWAISRYGSSTPTLVDEVDEIFSLNFLYAVSSAEAAKPTPEAPAEAQTA